MHATARDVDLIGALAVSDDHVYITKAHGKQHAGAAREGGGYEGAGAGGPLGESVGGGTEGGAGVWERVGKRWAESGNIGFSAAAAPVKARAMSYGLALGRTICLSVCLFVCLAMSYGLALGTHLPWVLPPSSAALA
jgi:hypothetical protein